MTDDTDTGDEAPEHAVSLPLIDTFAALEAELAAKEDRIERLEAELADGYLEPAATGPEMAADGEGPADEEEELPTHEDWEPETDPLEDTGAVDAEREHEGVTAEARGGPSTTATAEQSAAGANDAASAESPDDAPAPSDDAPAPTDDAPAPTDESSTDSGLQPVRTAGTPEESGEESATGSTPESASGSASEPAEPTSPTERADAEGEFGVTMETSSNLTGGSLGSSAGEGSASTADEGETDDAESEPRPPDPTADRGERLSLLVRRAELRDEDAVVETFVRGIEALDDVTREMLAHYRESGDAAPVDAHVAAGGSGERQYAYARNRTLRKAGVIEHDGAGRYRYALPSLVEEAFDGHADGQTLADAVAAIEDAADLD